MNAHWDFSYERYEEESHECKNLNVSCLTRGAEDLEATTPLWFDVCGLLATRLALACPGTWKECRGAKGKRPRNKSKRGSVGVCVCGCCWFFGSILIFIPDVTFRTKWFFRYADVRSMNGEMKVFSTYYY